MIQYLILYLDSSIQYFQRLVLNLSCFHPFFNFQIFLHDFLLNHGAYITDTCLTKFQYTVSRVIYEFTLLSLSFEISNCNFILKNVKRVPQPYISLKRRFWKNYENTQLMFT